MSVLFKEPCFFTNSSMERFNENPGNINAKDLILTCRKTKAGIFTRIQFEKEFVG